LDYSLDAIPPLTLEDQVLERLREAILEGVFPPGSQLNQVQVAAQFGVSRGPVRAAVNKLEKEGLVRNVPHRGTFVTPLDKKTVRDLYSVRAVLEAYGVRLAVAHCTPEDIEEFCEIVDEMCAAAGEGNVEKVVRLDFEVHEFFIQLSGNSFLLQTWSTIKVQVRRVLAFRHRSYPDIQDIADSHLPFIDLMRRKNADEAARVMEAHIHDALHDLMQRWQ
jgi:DNA-binding GntR family transcriptional regulator